MSRLWRSLSDEEQNEFIEVWSAEEHFDIPCDTDTDIPHDINKNVSHDTDNDEPPF